MSGNADRYCDPGISAQVDSIRATVSRFDEATLAAAYSIRDAEIRLHEATLTQADAESIWDAACAVAPHAPGIITMLSNLDGLPMQMQTALPELVNDTNIARITDALRFIDNELNNYFADSDTAHLTNALDTGLQNFHQALRRSFGYWQRSLRPVADFDLRQEHHQLLASSLLNALQKWVPGSDAQLRGSLGSGTADDYSDIDICWVVPDDSFTEAVDTMGAVLSCVKGVSTLHVDPECAHSAGRRLAFAHLSGVPLFWRVNIDIRANSVAADDLYDAHSSDAYSEAGWPGPASAIENAIEAIEVAVRGQANAADVLLRRGFERIGRDPGPTADLADAIISLADACATQEPCLTSMAAEMHQVVDQLLRSARTGDE